VAASRGGGRHRAGSIRHESDLLSTLRLSRSDALAPRRRRSLSTQSHPPARRSPVDPLRAPAEMPTALSHPRVRADIQLASVLASRPSSRSAPTLILHSTRCQPVPNFPRLRALALFGRRPPQRVEGFVMPASKNQNNYGHDAAVVAAKLGRFYIAAARSVRLDWVSAR